MPRLVFARHKPAPISADTRDSPVAGAARLAWLLALLYALDRLLKLLAVDRFFRRPPPPAPATWPSVTLLCPITRSPNDLRRALEARARLVYPGPLRCLLICDAADAGSQAICRAVMAAHPGWGAELILARATEALQHPLPLARPPLDVSQRQGAPPSPAPPVPLSRVWERGAGGAGEISPLPLGEGLGVRALPPPASKVAKLAAALPQADGELLCFVDDDILLRPDALRLLAPYALQPGAGAAFGLACYTSWGTLAESLMSGFVNTNALFSYVPLTFLAEPFTITGHCYAITRARFDAVGGLEGMADRIDDDHELARRVARHGLRNVQSPLIYDVENRLAGLADYHAQIRRWMLIPRHTMLPGLGPRARGAMLLTTAGTLLPPLVALLALIGRRPAHLAALGLSFGAFLAAQAHIEQAYLRRPTPPWRRPLLAILAYLTPLHVALAALGGRTIRWRGQRLRFERDGRVTGL